MRRQQRRRYALHSLRTSECSSVSSADSRRCRRRAVCRRTDERPAAGHMIRDPPSRCALPRTPAAIRSERSLEQTDLTTAKYFSISAAELQTPTPGEPSGAIVYALLPLPTLSYHNKKKSSGRLRSVSLVLLYGILSLSL